MATSQTLYIAYLNSFKKKKGGAVTKDDELMSMFIHKNYQLSK